MHLESTRNPVAVSSVPSRGLAARALGVLVAPRATFAEVAAQPKIFGMLLVSMLVAAIPVTLFLSTDVGQNAFLDMQVRQLESFGVEISDQMYEGMQRRLPYAPYFQAAGVLAMVPLLTTLTAGVIIAIFSAGLGGNATFRQVMAVAAHAGFVPALSSLFTAPLNFARESMSSATNLAVFAPFLEEGTFPARLLGMIDLFYIWWVVTLAIGVGVLYKRRTAPIAWGVLACYLVVVLAIAGVMTGFAGA